MKFLRQKKVELNDIDSRWKDCFVLVGTKGYIEVQEMTKTISKLQNKSDILDLKIQRIKNKISTVEDSEFDTLIQKLEELTDESERLNQELMSIFIVIARENFISGIIFDSETEVSRPMTIEDINVLDTEIIGRIAKTAIGRVEKKD